MSYTSINVSLRSKSFKKGVTLPKNVVLELAKKATKYYFYKGTNVLNETFKSSQGSGIILTTNEIKDIGKELSR